MKKILTLALLIGLSYLGFAQKPAMTFTTKEHDFGTVKEEVGRISYVFEFINTGTADLVLKNVQASCGCTTPEWTKSPVTPGNKGFINVTYSTLGRPGPFSKSITVTTNTNAREILTIKGNVLKRELSIEEQYPFPVGGLRFKSKFASFTNISDTETRTEIIEFINTSKADITISSAEVNKKYMTVTASVPVVKPNEKGAINITYDAKKRKDLGPQTDNFIVVLNGNVVKTDEFKFTTVAYIVESFTPEQRKKPAIAQVGKDVNFETVAADAKKVLKTTITNTGKSNLIIRKAYADCDCMVVKPSKTTIAPGKSADIKVELNTTGLPEGEQRNVITLIVNEPDNTRKTIPVSFNVEKKK
jgi:hypothetical protein